MKQTTERMTLRLWPDAARLLGVGRTAIYNAAKRGEIPTIRIGHLLLVPRSALERLLMIEPQPGPGAGHADRG